MIFADFLLFAADANKRQTGLGDIMIPMVAIFFLFYFIVLRPQQKAQTGRKEKMLDMIKKNARVLTNSGIFGVVTNVNPDAKEVTVRVDEANNTKLRMTRDSIAHVFSDDSSDEK